MVDINDIYLNIKINYLGANKTIKTTEILTVDEIKERIQELFSLKKCKKENLELYNTKNNKILSANDDIFYLAEEQSEYLYFFEINLVNKNEKNIEGLAKEVKEIKENNKKIKEMKLEIIKYKLQIEHLKKVKELKMKINIHKAINKIKDDLVNELMANKREKMEQKFNQIEEIIKNTETKINKIINAKKEDLKKELGILSNEDKKPMSNDLAKLNG